MIGLPVSLKSLNTLNEIIFASSKCCVETPNGVGNALKFFERAYLTKKSSRWN